jgi:hypothetical protein
MLFGWHRVLNTQHELHVGAIVNWLKPISVRIGGDSPTSRVGPLNLRNRTFHNRSFRELRPRNEGSGIPRLAERDSCLLKLSPTAETKVRSV